MRRFRRLYIHASSKFRIPYKMKKKITMRVNRYSKTLIKLLVDWLTTFDK